jgi:hypothetical protein
MWNRNLFVCLATALVVVSCKKDEIDFAAEPSIEFVSITPATATQYTDAVTITIRYEDGDGDLGENADGVKNCFVTDNRIGITYQYRIQQLAPDGASIPIAGNLEIDLGGQVITDSTSQQHVNFTLYVVDRAGHASNSVTTGDVVILR